MTALLPRVRRLAAMRPSRIGLRLLASNLLVVFLPVAGILYLDIYETQLLEGQERAMVQQARLVSAALGGRAQVDADAAVLLLKQLGQRGDARLRVYGPDGALLADSARAPDDPGARVVESPAESTQYPPRGSSIRERLLYRLAVTLVRAREAAADAARRLIGPTAPPPGVAAADGAPMPPEVRTALQGKYGAATRPTPGQRSLTLNSAVPIRDADRVIGAVVASQSTFRILQALYRVRLRIFQIVVISMVVAAALSIITSRTIVRPIVRLRRAAQEFSDRRRAAPDAFRGTDRADEIGDLARALDELSRQLVAHITLLESFAADVSHEFKNPLASIRVTAEMLASANDEADHARLLAALVRDVDRLDRLVSGVRELARIDAEVAREPLTAIDLRALIADIVDGARLSMGEAVGVEIALHAANRPLLVRAAPDRLAQVFENLLQNACSFAPRGSRIDATVSESAGRCTATVCDRGPGIPVAHVARVFDRFFTYRPDAADRREHAGLGLAIARAIVDGYRGAITASNRPDGGACFEVRLPSVRGRYV